MKGAAMETTRIESAGGSAVTLPAGGDGTDAGAAMSSCTWYRGTPEKSSDFTPTEADTLHRVYTYILTWPVAGGAS